jgi:hypothetical protein
VHFFDFYNAIWSLFEKSNAQKILVKGGGTQINSQKILVKGGGTQIGTFLNFDNFDKSQFSKIISSDFDILNFNFLFLLYID